MRRKFFSIITALALCLSLCPTWALAVEGEPSLCKHHQSHTAECGYVQADPGTPCGYVCRICPIEALIAALPDTVTEDNAAIVRGQLDEILDLFTALNEDEQEEINLSRIYALQGALDAANAPMAAAETITVTSNTDVTLIAEDGGCQGHTFTGTTQWTRIYVKSGTHDVTFSNLSISAAVVGVASGATMNLTIEGTNTIKVNGNYAGIYVPVGAALVIDGNGSLDVSGGSSAGIGGGTYDPSDSTGRTPGDPNCGTVEINGGTITATGGNCAAGIGGGSDADNNPGNGGTVTINGGTVTAKGGSDNGHCGGAGIGGSAGASASDPAGNGGTLTINGGHVTLTPGAYDTDWGAAYGFGQGSGSAPGGTCELTLTDASYLDSSTTLDPKGKYTINGDPTADMIVVPELVYTGEVLNLDGEIYIDDSKTGTGTYFGQTFTVKASAEGWELQPLGEVVNAGTYTAVFKKGEKEIRKTFTVAKSGTQFVEDGAVKTYKDGAECSDFTASDTITVKATPTPTGDAPTKAAARLRGDPVAGQMAVFVGDTQVSEPVGAGEDGSYTMTVNAADVLLAAGGPKTGITLTAKFVGNDNMADGAGTATVNISAVAKAEKDGTVISYYGESNLADAFTNDGATVTLLDNVTVTSGLTVKSGQNITFEGRSFTLAQTLPEGETATMTHAALTVEQGGTLTVKSGTITSPDIALNSCNGTLYVEGGEISGGKAGLVYGADCHISGGKLTGDEYAAFQILSDLDVRSILLNFSDNTADKHYAYYQNGSPYDPTGAVLPSGTFTVQECQHTGVEATNNNDGTHRINCPYCGFDAAEPHKFDENGYCPACKVQAVARVEKSGSETAYYETIETAWTAADSTAVITLLGNVTLPEGTYLTLSAGQGITLNSPEGQNFTLSGNADRTISVTGGTLKLGNVTVKNPAMLAYVIRSSEDATANIIIGKDAAVIGFGGISQSGGELTVFGTVTGTPFEGIYALGTTKLTVNEGANISGSPGLFLQDKSVITAIKGGTFTGGSSYAISSSGPFLNGLLGHTDETRYAYYKDGITLVTEGLNSNNESVPLNEAIRLPAGIYTVKPCTHVYQYTHTTGSTTHAKTCPACGDAKTSEKCDFSNGVCPCGAALAVTLPENLNLTYTGEAQEPPVTVAVDGTPLTAGTDYTVAYADNVNAGEAATATVTGTAFTGTVTKTFSIGRAALTVTPPAAALSYGQKLSDSALTGGGAVNSNSGATAEGKWAWANPDTQPTETGTFSATFKPNDTKNYETPASVNVTVTVNETAPKLTLTVPGNQVAGGEVTVACQVENPYDAAWKGGLPAVTLSCSNPSVTIENGKFTVPENAQPGTKITVTASTEAVDGKYTAATQTAVVTVTDKIPVTITGVTAQGGAYNGSTHSGYTGTPTASPYSGGFTITYATADGTALSGPPTNAGDYTVTIDLTEAAKGTYAANPVVLSFSITKASATVTADSQTITKGDPVPAYSCTVSPTGANLGFTPTLSCTYTTESGTGEYPITVTGADTSTDGNYTITYVDGKLTVKEPSSSGGGGGGGGDTPVNVTGVSLDRNSLTLTIGESFSLTVTITPSNADNKSVTWASGNSDVASVNGGTVTATGVGTTTITVTTQSGGYMASCTVTVKAKAYTITYNANGGAGTMRTGSAADGEPFTLPGCTFTPPEDKVFDAWAIGSADGTQAKAGSSHTFTEDTTVYAVWKDAPLVTYAVTYNANGGTGTMSSGIAPDQEAFVLPECGFTAPEGKEFDCWAIGSATGPKVQPGGSFTFTADTTVYALWKDLPPVPYDITGIVWQNGEAVPGATVQLKRGADVVAAQTTGADGGFTFSGVPAGVYNLVAIKDGITVTVMQEITSGSVNLTITLPNGKTNTVVEIKGQEGTPPVVVGEMENLFTDDTVYTAEDKEIVATGGTVEFKMVVGKQDASSSAAIQIEASKPAGQTIGLFLDLSIIKTVTPKDGQAETTSVTQVGSLIETLIPLPDEMQGKASYTVYREHDGIVEALPNSGNGERYTVSSDKKSITIYARKYSTYAVAWSDNGGDTPVDPDKPSRPSGGGGSSVSTYAVTVSKTTYGKVVSSRTNASSGSTVTLTVTPDSGYTLDTLAVTDSRGNAVKLTDKGDGKYTFTMPSRAVTVTASFAPIVWNNPYTDVATGTWYYEAVRFVSENGLMGGYGKGLFGPNDNLSRAQLVQILYNHAGRPVIQNGIAFTDAAPGAWYADAVTWAAAEGIISGYGGGRFGPNDPITREQLATILWRYAGFPIPPNLLLDFPDANTASGYALDALRWAVDQGIISGYSNGRLEPKTPATRGQVAQILRNFLQKQ